MHYNLRDGISRATQIAAVLCALSAASPAQVASTGTDASIDAVGTDGREGNLSREDERPALEHERLALDREKFAADREIENKKLDIERETLEVERLKVQLEQAKIPWTAWLIPWTALSTIVPLLGVLLTVAVGVWSLRRQTAAQVQTQNENARLTFELKAAEIAFAGRTPRAVLNRGNALKAIFGSRLPTEFLAGFNPETYGGDKEPPEEKKLLLELLLKYPDKKNEVLEYWDRLFPGDHKWLERLRTESQPANST